MKEITPAWRRRMDEEVPPVVWVLHQEAVQSGYWLYHTKERIWFTPEEFLTVWQRYYRSSRRGDNMHDFKVMDPMIGERSYKKHMRDAMATYLKFRNKVEDYYQLGLIKKK